MLYVTIILYHIFRGLSSLYPLYILIFYGLFEPEALKLGVYHKYANFARGLMKSTDGNPPALLDPFAGGGAIPLEAQRLGLEAHASDLNPVAVMINKAMIEIPPKFAGQPPVNPIARRQSGVKWTGARGLAEDVRYYGEWMKREAFERIGHLYPKVKDEHGQEHTVIAWIWARTVKCPNPACGCEMPLASSFVLSKKKGKEAYVQPIIEGKTIRYEVKYGKNVPEPTKTARGAKFKCICCGELANLGHVRSEAQSGHCGAALMAVVAEAKGGKLFITPGGEQLEASRQVPPGNLELGTMPTNPRWFSPPLYGITEYQQMFTDRQIATLNELCSLLEEMQSLAEADGCSQEYSQALRVYLAFVIDKIVAYSTSFGLWRSDHESFERIYGRQAIAMVWITLKSTLREKNFSTISLKACANAFPILPQMQGSPHNMMLKRIMDCVKSWFRQTRRIMTT